jgi:hypothetical protein
MPRGNLIPLHLLPEDVARSISSNEFTKEGSIKVKLWGENAALEKALQKAGALY